MRLDPAGFEALYEREADPWGFASSEYERAKYAATVAALEPGRRYARGLECGCSIGVLTERLADVCERLHAFDASPTAVARARARLASRPDVAVAVGRLPEDLPAGAWDLVVCSEILYYFDAPALAEVLDAVADRLAPGGSLLLVHWRPATRTYPLRGDEVHALAARRLRGLRRARSAGSERYRLDRYDRPGAA